MVLICLNLACLLQGYLVGGGAIWFVEKWTELLCRYGLRAKVILGLNWSDIRLLLTTQKGVLRSGNARDVSKADLQVHSYKAASKVKA